MASASEVWAGLAARVLGSGSDGRGGIVAEQPIMVAAVATLLVVLVTTRLTTGRPPTKANERLANGKASVRNPPVVSHWIPFVGNTPWMLLDKEGFLEGLRHRFEGIFSMTMMGTSHYFVHKPSLASAIFSMHRTEAEEPFVRNRAMSHIFLFPNVASGPAFDAVVSETQAQYKFLLSEPSLGKMVAGVVRCVRRDIADFVTFNAFPADQAEWERRAGADVVDDAGGDGRGAQAVEVDLFQLVRNFVARTAMPSIFGSDLVENFPDMVDMLWLLDDAFLLLAAGWPAWIPNPRVQRGRAARRRLLDYLREYGEAMARHRAGEDAGARWQNLDDASDMVKTRADVWRRHDLSLDGRAALDLSLMWALSANANPLIVWILFEVARDPVLVEQIREEIAPHVRAVQPSHDFGPAVWVSPELGDVDVEALVTRCPLLKAAYVETARLYASTWILELITHDTVLKDSGKEGGGGAYLLKAGSCAHVPIELHTRDPSAFPDPNEWRPERHVKETVNAQGEKVLTADMGSIRLYGGGAKMCKGRSYAVREILLYVAVILSFYDIVPIKGGPWPKPKLNRNAGACHPAKPLRVWIKKRKLPKAEP
ncbi:25-hydroxycholesterol 7-alpha-hydroxylase [Escovopsis weberi]|uniref:25-hydroxycholesterol 7-alpha-hydroxylase n=1 Tax=Escovopsis weberi TaxID=150374 RepID=A0A0M8MRA2_ESCWE|nr:25-hydroxycholesterol 7-alpha-hydroxylase [Escovopsis weberi]